MNIKLKSNNLLPAIVVVAAILVVAYLAIYPNFIKKPEISVAKPVAQTAVNKGELAQLMRSLLSNPQFTKLEQHGELLPVFQPTGPAINLQEIKDIGPVGRPNPFAPGGL